MEAVVPAGPADEAGIAAGDRVLSLDSHPLRDIIDYQFHLEPGRQELKIVRGRRQLTANFEHGIEDPGIVFAGAVFDRVRTCACNCLFCFVDQLPPGLRPSLYLKDDDFRLSFLDGNFITLNSIAPADLDRIIAQRLSPLYVSVHATDPKVRAQMMGVSERTAIRGLENLARLGEAGIETHIQVVLCPGLNDGEILEGTVRDLAASFPGVASMGVVPVSLVKEHAPMRRVRRKDSIAVIEAVEGWQEEFRQSRGDGLVYAADEFYLLAGRDLPSVDAYDGFSQYENGIGIAASFLADVGKLAKQLPQAPPQGGSIYLLTGTLAAGMVQAVCDKLNRAPSGGGLEERWISGGICKRESGRNRSGCREGGEAARDCFFRLLVVENRLLGPHVTVTGLLGGRDIIAAARAATLGRRDLLLIPQLCLNNPTDQLFLDGISLDEMNETLPCAVLQIV